ncbi:sulfite exporter TauE/SafE family protein [Agromyces mangrovi Wang et al. 2018]|uniref:sulfite exporter TauE/SafE family protein n=1 Tax=Agromyces mangrovi TaxID=1858653 RepID=UPI002573E96C|nr:sulfite exporter TauE/SafE family protein [Agromyces mangrovi]BDZ64022.1 UPF0721 transmembrane protein [Agromyces mangrovi]
MTTPPATPSDDQARGGRYWFWLATVGVIGGVLSGAFGVGGGIIMVPLLIFLTGMDQRRASATSLAAIVPTAVAGAATYFANGQVDVLAALFVAVGGVVGSYLGAMLLRRISLTWLRWMFIAVMLIAAVRLFLVVPMRGDGVLEIDVWTAIALSGLGLAMGIASGLFGVGGGIIAVPGLMALFGMGDLIAKGTSLLVMIPTAISGTVANSRGGLVKLSEAAVVGVAATAASFAGVALAFWMPPALASYLFAALIVFAAVQLAIRAVRAQRKG